MSTATSTPTLKPVAQLRISRRDVINQIIADARSESAALLKTATERRTAACLAFANAVSAMALEMGKAVIKEIQRVNKREVNFIADFRFDPKPAEDDDEVKPTSDAIEVELRSQRGEDRWGRRDYQCFFVEVKLTRELRKLHDEAMEQTKEVRALREITGATQSELRARASRKLLNQAIRDLPEGDALLELMGGLRKRVEKRTGKHLLLSE